MKPHEREKGERCSIQRHVSSEELERRMGRKMKQAHAVLYNSAEYKIFTRKYTCLLYLLLYYYVKADLFFSIKVNSIAYTVKKIVKIVKMLITIPLNSQNI